MPVPVAAFAPTADRAAWAAFATALTVAVAVGGGGGATVRAVVGSGMLLALLALAADMLRGRRGGMPGGRWWLLPVGAVALAGVQLALPPWRSVPGLPQRVISWNPAATVQAAAWWGAAGAAMLAGALLLRTAARWRGMLGAAAARWQSLLFITCCTMRRTN